jgi:hypothetical protein
MNTTGWGGKREGAGRKRKDGRIGPTVPHVPRPTLRRGVPAHVVWRVEPDVWDLRDRRCADVIEQAIAAGDARFGVRIVGHELERDRLHLVIEAADPRGFESTMQGLGIRLARQLNRLMGRKGKFFYDRFEVSSPALKI